MTKKPPGPFAGRAAARVALALVAPPPRLPTLLPVQASNAFRQQSTATRHGPRGLGAGALRHGVLPGLIRLTLPIEGNRGLRAPQLIFGARFMSQAVDTDDYLVDFERDH